MRAIITGLQVAICDAISAANRNREHAYLAGAPEDEVENPYDRLESLLLSGLDRVRFLRSHRCEWDDDDRCVHCNADGRA